MATSRRYIHDRLVLLLLTANTFFTVLTAVWILLRLNSGRHEGYIVQYRPSLGLSAFYKGDNTGILSFAVFSLFVLVFHTLLSIRVYSIRRHLALVILGMGLLLILLSLVISNALLLLR
ncbi:MAG TPA: hypothetical protein VLE74_00890 [Candidatus Saccharimonadales bacterium]|nr:hypothetical protein [Candidatus Saccharimonadales bacterium]